MELEDTVFRVVSQMPHVDQQVDLKGEGSTEGVLGEGAGG
jgi:hypothetical protein